MKKSDRLDFFNSDLLLTEEEKVIRREIEAFVDKEIKHAIENYNRNSKFPQFLIKKMAELGIFGATFPEKYGGSGLNNVEYGLIMQELERGDSSIRSFASVQSSLVMFPIYQFGSDEQKKYWLPKLAKAEQIGCFGLTEPDYGSNPAALITKAEKIPTGYRLNGTKMWITNGSISDIAIIWAKLDGVIRGFIVEKERKGFSSPEMKGKHSLKASITSELVLEDVEIPEANLLPKTEGLKSALMCLNQARYGIAWGVIGAALDCFYCALDYSRTRIQFDKSIASYQLTQQKLAYIATEITKSQLLNIQLGRLKDKGIAKHYQISMAKMNNCDKALEIARICREILGANGILDEYPVMRHASNLESVKTYEGTHEIHSLIIGEKLTGISAYR